MPLLAHGLPNPAFDPAPAATEDLTHLAILRLHWARSRCLPRYDLMATRAQAAPSVEAATLELLQALDCAEALGGLHLFEPGAQQLSFDEKWLLACLAAATAKDTDSLTFLLHSRLKRCVRRQIGARVLGLAELLRK
ncbi:hypothetical protein [Gymnodinialimonas sp.]